MSKYSKVSLSVIRRLPKYYRYLEGLTKKNVVRISSRELAEALGSTASQIRQDLNSFGGFGQQGYGYNVKNLYTEIGEILGVNKLKPTIIMGAGNLGLALANYMHFEERGFRVVGIFDSDPIKIGVKVGDIVVQGNDRLKSFCGQHEPEVAVLCVPDKSVTKLVHDLIDVGIKGFWNFSHYDIKLDYPQSDIAVESVNLGDSIMTLSFQMEELKANVD